MRAPVVACVLSLVAALVLGAGCGTTISATGTVLDARTGKPVAGAQVTQSTAMHGHGVVAGRDGRFTLDEVTAGLPLAVSAPDYAAQSVTAASALTVRLVPIPVTGTVLSAYGGVPVPGAHVGPGTAGEDGRFAVYGVGPGDTMLVASRLYASASVPVGVSRTVDVRLTPARIDPHLAVAAVATYTVTPLPSHDAEVLAGLQADPRLKGTNPAVASSSVALPGGNVDVILAIVFDPAVAEQPGFVAAVLNNLVNAVPGVSVGATFHGIPVLVTHQTGGKYVVSWQQATTFFSVLGLNQAGTEALAGDLILANS